MILVGVVANVGDTDVTELVGGKTRERTHVGEPFRVQQRILILKEVVNRLR